MTLYTLPRFDQPEASDLERSFGAVRTAAGNLPLKQLAYRTRIVGLVTRTDIVQTYYNPFDQCIEATYVFPMEADQAVTGCELRVAGRIVRAKLQERGEARENYRRAIARGHRAALLEENRPETFSMKVGNIPPGEAVQVRIQTVGHLAVVHEEWTLRLPLVVAPRYTSGIALPRNPVGDGTELDTDQVPDASCVTPPTWLPGFASPVDLRLEVAIEPGRLVNQPDWPRRLRSSLHSVLIESEDDKCKIPVSCRVQVHPGERVDRDFIIRGDLATSEVKTTLFFEPPRKKMGAPESGPDATRSMGNTLGTFALQILAPPAAAQLPRDIVFVLDRSGSMGGWKIAAARRGISRLIDSLSAADRFHVLAFDNRVESPFGGWLASSPTWRPGTDANRYRAVEWLARINARGGTEMGMALKQGVQTFLTTDSTESAASTTDARLPAMVLVTDGQITGEDSVLRLLGTVPQQQRPRLFCLGIDRAVNASLLKRMANLTGGTFELAESEKRLDEVMRRFADEIGSPAVMDLEIRDTHGEHGDLQLAPHAQRVLYAGRAASIYGRAACDRRLALTVSGHLAGGQRWEQQLSAETTDDANGHDAILLPMWGRARVRELEDALVAGGRQDPQRRAEIIDCSLQANVLSRFTAYLAVDETERVHDGRLPHQIAQPAELPEGWLLPVPVPLDRLALIPLPGRRPVASEPIPSSSAVSSPLPPHFKDHMIQLGIVSVEQFAEAEARSQRTGHNVGQSLVQLQYATYEDVARVAARTYQVPYVDWQHIQIAQPVLELIPESVARENEVLPYSESDGVLTVLTHNPGDLEMVEKLRFILNRDIRVMVTSRSAIHDLLNLYYGQVEGESAESADSMLQEFTDTAIDFTETEDDRRRCIDSFGLIAPAAEAYAYFLADSIDVSRNYVPKSEPDPVERGAGQPRARRSTLIPEEAPLIRLVELILAEAVQMRATHIILRPRPDAVQVVYVIDGAEVERDAVPRRLLAGIITRLKILAQVDVSIVDQRQVGTCQVTARNQSISASIHFAPGADGEHVLIDLVDQLESKRPEPVQAWWRQHSVAPAG